MNAMNNIYFFQPGYVFGEGREKSAYLPYAAGVVAAYAFSRDKVKASYRFGGFFSFFDEPSDILKRMENPVVAAFSNYVWNYDYNLRIASLIKKSFPGCAVVFGGHQVSPGSEVLEEYQFVDYLIHGEGEEAFSELAEALASGGELTGIPSLSFRNDVGSAVTNKTRVSRDGGYPSPYLSGLFDEMVNNSDINFSAIFETNRGCPYVCTYCDWGITGKNFKFFPIERVKKEIAWMAEHKIEHCFAADGNFGISERDAEIADLIIESKQKYGYPKRFDVTYAKENADRVFSIAAKLYENGMFKGPSISFQTLCPEALKNVGRSNMSTDAFSALLQKYNARGIPAYSEMILGLPGETYESFCRGIGILIEYGQHNYIDIFRCEVLLNSGMGKKEYLNKHKIRTVKTPTLLHHIPFCEDIRGHSLIVVSTESMTREEYIRANLFSMIVQSCHHMGLLRYAAIFVRRACGVRYDEFYNAFLSMLESDNGRCGVIFSEFKKLYTDFAENGCPLTYHNELFGGITWYPEEGAFLEFLQNAECFYIIAKELVTSFGAGEDVTKDLLQFQKNAVRFAGRHEAEFSVSFNWPDYFAGSENFPEKEACILILSDPDIRDDWQGYARENVWYGRRAGKTLYPPERFLKLIKQQDEMAERK